MSATAFLEVQLYADGRKVAFFGAPSRPAYLPSSDYVGLINQDPRPATGEYAVDVSRFALRGGPHPVATWIAVYRGRPDPVLGDRGTYVGAGLWLLDNPLIAVDQVVESLRHIVDRAVQIMDADPPRAARNIDAQLPQFAQGAIEWLRTNGVGGATDKDLGLPGSDGAPLDARRATVRMRNVFGSDALTAISSALIARVRGNYTRMLLLQDAESNSEQGVADRRRTYEALFGVSAPLNALNHHAVNYSVGSAARERTARESAHSATQSMESMRSEHQQMAEELELLRQTADRQRLDLQRADTALRNERAAHEDTRAEANQAARLRADLERANAEFLAYKAKVRAAGQSPELKDRLREGVSNAVRQATSGSSSNSGGNRRVQKKLTSDVDFYRNNKNLVYIALGVIGLLIAGSMVFTYVKDRKAATATTPTIEPLPAPTQSQGVIDATAQPSPGGAQTTQPQVVDPAAQL